MLIVIENNAKYFNEHVCVNVLSAGLYESSGGFWGGGQMCILSKPFYFIILIYYS